MSTSSYQEAPKAEEGQTKVGAPEGEIDVDKKLKSKQRQQRKKQKLKEQKATQRCQTYAGLLNVLMEQIFIVHKQISETQPGIDMSADKEVIKALFERMLPFARKLDDDPSCDAHLDLSLPFKELVALTDVHIKLSHKLHNLFIMTIDRFNSLQSPQILGKKKEQIQLTLLRFMTPRKDVILKSLWDLMAPFRFTSAIHSDAQYRRSVTVAPLVAQVHLRFRATDGKQAVEIDTCRAKRYKTCLFTFLLLCISTLQYNVQWKQCVKLIPLEGEEIVPDEEEERAKSRCSPGDMFRQLLLGHDLCDGEVTIPFQTNEHWASTVRMEDGVENSCELWSNMKSLTLTGVDSNYPFGVCTMCDDGKLNKPVYYTFASKQPISLETAKKNHRIAQQKQASFVNACAYANDIQDGWVAPTLENPDQPGS